jgi:hypothetical protein
MELVVPNPSGGRGVYIVGGEGILQICRPSIHDLVLNERIGKLQSLTPGRVRMTAAQVAAEGFVGRSAIGPARTAIAAAIQARGEAFRNILLALLAASGLPAAEWQAVAALSNAAMRQQAPTLLAKIATAIDRAPDEIAIVLLDMAEAFAGFGVSATADGIVQRRLDALQALLTEATALAAGWPERACANAARIIAAATLTVTQAALAIGESRAAMADPAALLRGWFDKPEAMSEQIGQPAWLLDGWEQICLLWQTAGSPSLLAARLDEIVLLLPLWPRAMRERLNLPPDADTRTARRQVQSERGERGAGVNTIDLTVRNEALRLTGLQCAGMPAG